MKKDWKEIRSDIDTLIEISYKVRLNSIKCPPAEDIWPKVASELKKVKRKQRLRRLKPVFAASIILILLMTLFVNYQTQVVAFANSIINSIIKYKEHTLVIEKDNIISNQKENYEIIKDSKTDSRISEAQENISFKLLTPQYVPENFELSKVDVINQEKGHEAVIFVYYNTSGDKAKFFHLQQTNIESYTKTATNLPISDNTKVRNIIINGTNCTLINHDTDLNIAIWDIDNISFRIDGSISEKEIIKIITNLE